METPRHEPEPVSVGMMLRLFLVPLAVVFVCVLVFLLFGLLAGDRKTTEDYLNEIRTGTEIRRWQAAYELAAWIATHDPENRGEDNPVDDLVRLHRDSAGGDARIRSYLTLALGRLGDPVARGTLVEALQDDDGETVIYSAWALGNIGDPAAAPDLAPMLRHSDPGVRKMAAHSLGTLGNPGSIPPLRLRLEDSEVDVAWNAALALGQLGDPMARPLLENMIRRDYLQQFPGVDGARTDEVMINALRALARLGDAGVRPRVEILSRTDPSTKVRSAALTALDQLPAATASPP
jgi:HEAT repeat protein